MKYQKTVYSHGKQAAVGILLANLGTPAEPTTPALRRYLAQFLSDSRVIELPKLFWWPILHGIILRIRPAKSAEKYRTVWTEAGSPLLAISQRQREAVLARLGEQARGPIHMAVGMRYGEPGIPAALRQLRDAGVQRLLVLPLYPQYSAATTAATFDALADELKTWRWLPELRMVNHYHDHPGYITALANSIREAWQQQAPGERLLFSFHGLPRANLLNGDPYHCECHKTARLVAAELGLPEERWKVSFQSRFGRAEWLQPYTTETLVGWAKGGVKSVDVICPGFSADCLETLEEIEEENREEFQQAGGQQYRYIPALNDRPEHIELITRLILQHGCGWAELDGADATTETGEITRERALAMGATD